ncbi:MAG: GDSL-type esterase/lipase family protein [Deltaproteobacteria bacterium]|jgi:lysophospholipase L1-like esterase|nr:GDSL-type esterase/lipase family protein [Deltaproteobacteria bacterium]
MLGDSLTKHGQTWGNIDPEAEVLNHGVGGDTAGCVLRRLSRTTGLRPEWIFLLAGVNDLAQGFSPESVEEGHIKIWSAVASLSPESRLVVCSLLPMVESLFDWGPGTRLSNDLVRKANRLLGRAAENFRLDFLDLHPAFAEPDGSLRRDLTDDGVHLLGPAYPIWESLVRDFLSSKSSGGR